MVLGHAAALIVSGRATGAATDPGDIQSARQSVPDTPIVVGSGATAKNLHSLGADAIIVGTALKVDGRADSQKATQFVERARQAV